MEILPGRMSIKDCLSIAVNKMTFLTLYLVYSIYNHPPKEGYIFIYRSKSSIVFTRDSVYNIKKKIET